MTVKYQKSKDEAAERQQQHTVLKIEDIQLLTKLVLLRFHPGSCISSKQDANHFTTVFSFVDLTSTVVPTAGFRTPIRRSSRTACLGT